MTPLPVFCIHSLADGRAVYRVAAKTGAMLQWVTPPHGVGYAGSGYYNAIRSTCSREYPGAPVQAYLDCGSDGAAALSALSAGWDGIVVDPELPALPRLADAVEEANATLRTGPWIGKVDMLWERDKEAACRRCIPAPPDSASSNPPSP